MSVLVPGQRRRCEAPREGAGVSQYGGLGHDATSEKRALVVSHACVVPANQSVYVSLADRGWNLDLVVPSRWRREYADAVVAPAKLPELNATVHALPVALTGYPQRHFYPRGCMALLRRTNPSVAFLEEESFSAPAFQWGMACWRSGVPFGIQAAENLDRDLPLPARFFRRWTLRHAAFIAARSPTAKNLVEQWGARGIVEVIPHAVPNWPISSPPRRSEPLTDRVRTEGSPPEGPVRSRRSGFSHVGSRSRPARRKW